MHGVCWWTWTVRGCIFKVLLQNFAVASYLNLFSAECFSTSRKTLTLVSSHNIDTDNRQCDFWSNMQYKGSYGNRQLCYFDATKVLKSCTVTVVFSLLAESTAAGVLSRMRHWVAILLLLCVVFLHLHGALGKRKPNIIFVDDVSGRMTVLSLWSAI